MKNIQAAAVFLCLSSLTPSTLVLAKQPISRIKSKPPSLLSFAVADARKEGKAVGWKGSEGYLAATKYIGVTLWKHYYIYSRDGKFIKSQPADYPSAGRMGDYAEVGWDYLDKNRKTFSDTYGYYLLHFKTGKWHKVARGGGYGYQGEVDLHKAGVPAQVIKRLKLG